MFILQVIDQKGPTTRPIIFGASNTFRQTITYSTQQPMDDTTPRYRTRNGPYILMTDPTAPSRAIVDLFNLAGRVLGLR